MEIDDLVFSPISHHNIESTMVLGNGIFHKKTNSVVQFFPHDIDLAHPHFEASLLMSAQLGQRNSLRDSSTSGKDLSDYLKRMRSGCPYLFNI